MRVSIVIPCWNHAPFVGQAIDSALAQTWHDIEVVVVNDGSTDRSGEVIRDAFHRAGHAPGRETGSRAGGGDGQRRGAVIEQPNRGLAAARNAGLADTTGDVVIFLDADDRLRPDAARAAMASLASRPDAMMTFGRCMLVDEAGTPLLTNLPLVERDFYAELLLRNYIWTPAMAAFRRDVFSIVGGFRRDVNPSADYDLYLRIARTLPVTRHHAVVAEYRQHGGNMSRHPVAMLDATLRVLAAQRSFVATEPRLKRVLKTGLAGWREFYGEHLVEQFRSALHAREMHRAASHALDLVRLYPRGVLRHLARKGRLVARTGRFRAHSVPVARDCAPVPHE